MTRSGKLLPLLDGKRHGFGVRVFSNGSRYEGQWDGDVAEGSGELHGVAGGKYEGSFWNGHRYGVTLTSGAVVACLCSRSLTTNSSQLTR